MKSELQRTRIAPTAGARSPGGLRPGLKSRLRTEVRTLDDLRSGLKSRLRPVANDSAGDTTRLSESPGCGSADDRREPAPRVAAVVPAYNEAGRIGAVLETLREVDLLDEIIVVSDGSTDRTYEVASAIPGIHAIRLAQNRGKGGAMRAGALHTTADVLLFLDADLIGLKPHHVRDLIEPVRAGNATMAMGIFEGGRWATDLAQRISPGITGQRAIRRDTFLSIPDIEKVGYGIELAITYYVRHHNLPRQNVRLRGITHPMKEEKLGWARGAASRTRMYWQMFCFRISYELHGRPPKNRKRKPK